MPAWASNMLALPFRLECSIRLVGALNRGARAFWSLRLACCQTALTKLISSRHASVSILSKHCKVNESDNTETEEEQVGLKIADLD
jgi:hypothetical protein